MSYFREFCAYIWKNKGVLAVDDVRRIITKSYNCGLLSAVEEQILREFIEEVM